MLDKSPIDHLVKVEEKATESEIRNFWEVLTSGAIKQRCYKKFSGVKKQD